ncbi:MAG: redoxin domain-containing protein [Thermomicrobium sp.]|nr:redoxin domain-containing protein [Thermomicrobium sp.]MDW7981618.1 redoxin domain-containing protein [Thermomicrobium sp.]
MAKAPLAPGDRLDDFELPTLDGRTVSTRRYYLRSGLLLLFSHEFPCDSCLDYLSVIERVLPEIRRERMEVIAVVPIGRTLVIARPADFLPQFPIGLGEGDELHRRFGFLDETGRPAAAVVVGDDTATIWHAWCAGAGHELPEPPELLEWVRFVSYQCPECRERNPDRGPECR